MCKRKHFRDELQYVALTSSYTQSPLLHAQDGRSNNARSLFMIYNSRAQHYEHEDTISVLLLSKKTKNIERAHTLTENLDTQADLISAPRVPSPSLRKP